MTSPLCQIGQCGGNASFMMETAASNELSRFRSAATSCGRSTSTATTSSKTSEVVANSKSAAEPKKARWVPGVNRRCDYQFAGGWVLGVQGSISATDIWGANADPRGTALDSEGFASDSDRINRIKTD